MPDVKDESRAALLAGIGCYSLWGLLPLWMYALRDAGVGAVEITAQRAGWAKSENSSSINCRSPVWLSSSSLAALLARR